MDNPNSTTNVVPKRGRPKIHEDTAEKQREYRRREKFRNLTSKKARAEWDALSPEVKILWEEHVTLTKGIQIARSRKDFEEVVGLEEQLEYLEQCIRAHVREPAPFETQGAYIHDAPKGRGRLIYASAIPDDENSYSELSRLSAKNENAGEERCAPRPDSDHPRKNPFETEAMYVYNAKRELDWYNWVHSKKRLPSRGCITIKNPKCHCGARSVTIHPEDTHKRLLDVRFICEQHKSEFLKSEVAANVAAVPSIAPSQGVAVLNPIEKLNSFLPVRNISASISVGV
jgi:hypothetical protein